MSEQSAISVRMSGKNGEVDILGDIGQWGASEESVAASNVIRDLRDMGRVDRLNINIHSRGGSVWDGLAIYRAIREAKARERVAHVNALSASIASVIMLAADRVEVAPEAVVMIHNPYMVSEFTSESEFDDAKARWKASKSSILNIYERVTGKKREELSAWMDAETWFTGGEEIKAAGFADTIKADAPRQRLAAIGSCEYWKNAPEALVKRKPQPLPPELEARARKLGVIG